MNFRSNFNDPINNLSISSTLDHLKIKLIENSSDEILHATLEMLNKLSNKEKEISKINDNKKTLDAILGEVYKDKDFNGSYINSTLSSYFLNKHQNLLND